LIRVFMVFAFEKEAVAPLEAGRVPFREEVS